MPVHPGEKPMNNTVRVMFVDVSGKGGITHHIVMMCNALSRKNIQVALVTTRTCEMDLKKVRFHHDKRLLAHHSKKSDLAKGIIYTVSMCFALFHILAKRPHIVHWHELKIYILEYGLIKWLKRSGIRTVCSVHDVVHQDRPRVTAYLRKLYLEFDALIAHTEDSKKLLRERFDVPNDRIHVIPVGEYSEIANSKWLTKIDARKQLGLNSRSKVLLFFGYIRKYKGLDLLIKAMPEVLRNDPDAFLIIAGESKEDFRGYERLIFDLNISHAILSQIQYIPLEHIPRYFYASDAVVMPYRSIYQSGIVHLAFAFRRPVIATQVGGLPEVVQDGKNGYLVRKDDVKALAQKIVQALSDVPVLEKMGEYAFCESKKRLSWSDIAEKAACVYRELHGGKRAA
jgi:glycosyltransferase involved in cell wall biosynthesis